MRMHAFAYVFACGAHLCTFLSTPFILEHSDDVVDDDGFESHE